MLTSTSSAMVRAAVAAGCACAAGTAGWGKFMLRHLGLPPDMTKPDFDETSVARRLALATFAEMTTRFPNLYGDNRKRPPNARKRDYQLKRVMGFSEKSFTRLHALLRRAS